MRVEEMRLWILSQGYSPKFQESVKKMPQNQVIAVYHRMRKETGESPYKKRGNK